MGWYDDPIRRSVERPWGMHSEITPAARHFFATIIGAAPALYIGFYVGGFAAQGDTPGNCSLTDILVRCLICAVPGALMAFSVRRYYWLGPWLIYLYGIYCGYTFLDDLFDGFFSAGHAPPHRHPELIWIVITSIWLACGASMLRRRLESKVGAA